MEKVVSKVKILLEFASKSSIKCIKNVYFSDVKLANFSFPRNDNVSPTADQWITAVGRLTALGPMAAAGTIGRPILMTRAFLVRFLYIPLLVLVCLLALIV